MTRYIQDEKGTWAIRLLTGRSVVGAQGEGVIPYMGSRLCGPKRYGYSAILAIFFINTVWFLHSS